MFMRMLVLVGALLQSVQMGAGRTPRRPQDSARMSGSPRRILKNPAPQKHGDTFNHSITTSPTRYSGLTGPMSNSLLANPLQSHLESLYFLTHPRLLSIAVCSSARDGYAGGPTKT